MKAFNHFKTMQGIGATRLRIGMSQEAFATELGISRSMVSMSERGERRLPMSALAKVSALEIRIAAAAMISSKEQMHPMEQCEGILNEHSPFLFKYKAESCRLAADSKECKLQVMIARYNQLRRSLDELELLVKTCPADTDSFQSRKLRFLQTELGFKLNRCSVAAQNALRTKIALLRSEAELHEMNAG
jgi:transcriptional regulator with XRE-family HTH domain